MSRPLGSGVAEVWFLRTGNARLTPTDCQFLSSEERDRATRFRFERDRHLYRCSRVLLRTVLSRYAELTPSRWVFTTGRHGKPRIASPEWTWLQFSLTHTNGLVCCAVMNRSPLGVDAENTRRRIDVFEIADRWFSAAERADLRASADKDRQNLFFKYWTLKESLTKASGRGLSEDLSRFSFRLLDPIRVRFDQRPTDDCTWHFRLFHPTPDHTIGVSVRRPVPEEVTIHMREASLSDLS